MTHGRGLGGAALIGVVCGMRSAMGPAALAWRVHVGGTRTRRLLTAAALGEVIADNTPLVPPRTSAPALGGRVLSGALCGRQLAGTWGAMVGGLGAFAATFGASRARAALGEATKVPDPVLGVAEDALAVAVAALATR
jgi:uncharacterized membrane protein